MNSAPDAMPLVRVAHREVRQDLAVDLDREADRGELLQVRVGGRARVR